MTRRRAFDPSAAAAAPWFGLEQRPMSPLERLREAFAPVLRATGRPAVPVLCSRSDSSSATSSRSSGFDNSTAQMGSVMTGGGQ